VVCISSDELKKNVLKAAGQNISMISDINNCFEIPGGLLPCKKILFVPWKGFTASLDALEQSTRNFVMIALQYAQQREYQTVSFPAIGEYRCSALYMPA
jgi:hypothetical protein